MQVIQGFISYQIADPVASSIAIRLDKMLDARGLHAWVWGKSQRTGHKIDSQIADAIRASHFFVPIISTHYSDSESCIEEVTLAKKVHKARKAAQFKAPFIFPIKLPNAQVPVEIESLGLAYAEVQGAEDLAGIEKLLDDIAQPANFAPAIVAQRHFSFDNLPEPFVLPNGGVDALIVLGHSAKRSGKRLSPRLEKGVTVAGKKLKPAPADQTNRPNEFVPGMISSFERESFRRNPRIDGLQDLPKPLCFTDEVLIDHEEYTELLGKHNLICLGAGDTNGITKWILDYYGGFLPVHFNSSDSSQVIVFSEKTGAASCLAKQRDPETGREIGIQSGKKGFAALTFIVPNPANHEKAALVVAGLVALGTQAVTIAISEWWRGIKENPGVRGNWLRVLEATEVTPESYRPGPEVRFLL